MVSSSVTQACTITGSWEEPCRAIATLRLENSRTLFPILSVQFWDSKKSTPRMASVVSVDCQVKPILSSAVSVVRRDSLLAVVPVMQAGQLPTPTRALLRWFWSVVLTPCLGLPRAFLQPLLLILEQQ